jgi:UDP-N-acetylmuramoyl-tripeptide--D-alanyl-D-alanine ligase
MKNIAKKLVVVVLGIQVRRLRKKNDFQIIAVSGSIGKTSTKLAVAKVLSKKYKVRYQEGNYNVDVTVPLVFFGQDLPPLFNPLAWLKVFWSNQKQLKKPYPYDFVILELSTDGPGQIGQFAKYLHVDLAILTAISLEHMEFFDDLDAVAIEELSIAHYSSRLLVNKDLSPLKYLKQISIPLSSYGYEDGNDFQIGSAKFSEKGAEFSIRLGSKGLVQATHPSISKIQLYSLCAAAAVAHEFDFSPSEITEAFQLVSPVKGRMRLFSGINGSTIIDDTYNSSPEAAKAALETLYSMKAPQKIALVGNMNELGKFARAAHQEVGELCDPQKLDEVLTLGPDANQFLAEAAEAKGCKVKRFKSPYEAGKYIKSIIKPGALVLAKGSQNKVFAEEAVKILLARPEDRTKLVRQDSYWLREKSNSFKS